MKEEQPQSKQQSPSIFRFITEYSLFPVFVGYFKLLVISCLIGILLIAILRQGFFLSHNLQELKLVQKERMRVTKEVESLEGLSKQYSGYRDLSVRIAALYYQLGDSKQATKNIEIALQLDPNFIPARNLEKLIESEK